MEKIFWIIPGKLAGRPGPVMEPWDLIAIRNSGITAVASADSRCDADKIAEIGLRHLHAFMPAVFPTSPALVQQFVSLLVDATKAVVQALQEGEVVLVHCFAGRDRTGLILCGALMTIEGLSAREALELVRTVQPMGLTSPGILDVLTEYEILLHASTD